MYSELLKATSTKDEVEVLIGELNLLIDSLYSSEEGGFDHALAKIRNTTASVIETYFQVNTDNDREGQLRDAVKKLKDLSELQLTVAYDPPRETLLKIVSWLRTNVADNVVLDIHISPSTIAGVVISYKGKYHDYSYKNKIEEYLQNLEI